MPAYLTPERYKTMGFGIDLSDMDNAELAALCAQASAWVDSYCLAPRLPQAHDFRGGVVTGEQHAWRYPESPFDIGQRKAYPFHWPITKINQFRIYVTNTQYVEIDPNQLFVNNSLRYVEVVSLALTSAGLFNALIIPNVGLATPTVRMNYEYGWSFQETGEVLEPTDGQTYRAQNQFWHTDAGREPVVMLDGIAQTSGFAIDANEGTVTFDADLEAGTVVSAAYYYKLPPEIQFATGHIVTWLHSSAEIASRGMARLDSLDIGEVKMRRPRETEGVRGGQAGIKDLDLLVPEAAAFLYSYRFDAVSVR